MASKEVVTTEEEAPERPTQHVDRRTLDLSPEGEVGPFFPSGMSAPEAAMVGATAGMDDVALEKIEAMRAEQGYGGAVEADDGEDA
jgi:hypothetical protein